MSTSVAITVPESAVDQIAERAAAIVLERLALRDPPATTYLTVPEAAELLRANRQRVYDLLSQGRLTRFKDGSRTLISRAEVESHVRGDGPCPGRRKAIRSVSESQTPPRRTNARGHGTKEVPLDARAG